MNLLTKIKDKLHGASSKPTSPAQETIKSLNNLPDKEKVKVLEYLKSVKELHKHKHKDE